jgi:hypothetical protein
MKYAICAFEEFPPGAIVTSEIHLGRGYAKFGKFRIIPPRQRENLMTGLD